MKWMITLAALGASVSQAQWVPTAEPTSPGPASPSLSPTQTDFAMLIIVSNRITAANPSCTVSVQAQWDPDLYAFNGALFDAIAEPDAGAFSDPEALLKVGGTYDGTIGPGGDSVTDVVSGQFCPLFGCDPGACPNPVDIWRATWSTEDFTPRTVNLSTLTAKFSVFIDKECNNQSFLEVLAEGDGQIVITCPADCDLSTGLGVLDLFDFLCFVNGFNAGAPEADCDGDSTLSLFDFLCFVNEFNAGC